MTMKKRKMKNNKMNSRRKHFIKLQLNVLFKQKNHKKKKKNDEFNNYIISYVNLYNNYMMYFIIKI
jgi:hypothetical protein